MSLSPTHCFSPTATSPILSSGRSNKMGQDLQGSVALLQDFSVSTPRDISSIALGKSRGGRVLDLIRRAECPQRVCAVTRRRFPVGASPTRRFAPAGSNRSRHGGDEMSEAFG